MTEKLNTLIKNYCKGDDNQFLLITERFKPAVLKYVKLLYKDEAEDTMAELNLSLLEAVRKIDYMYDEGQCCIFLNNALHNKYLELYRKSRKKFDNEQLFEQDFEICIPEYEYEHAELMEDFHKQLSGYTDMQKKILISIFIDGNSNTETASKYHVSRQYANQLKNRLCKEMRLAYGGKDDRDTKKNDKKKK